MKILKSLLTINDTDIYDVYRAFLAEDKPGGHENYNALLQAVSYTHLTLPTKA